MQLWLSPLSAAAQCSRSQACSVLGNRLRSCREDEELDLPSADTAVAPSLSPVIGVSTYDINSLMLYWDWSRHQVWHMVALFCVHSKLSINGHVVRSMLVRSDYDGAFGSPSFPLFPGAHSIYAWYAVVATSCTATQTQSYAAAGALHHRYGAVM